MIKDLLIESLHGLEKIESLGNKIGSLQDPTPKIEELQRQVADLQAKANSKQPSGARFVYVLQKDADGYSDDSWEEIIKLGQDLQYPYWLSAEETYGKKYGLGEGWSGSAAMPVIQILCEEPEYNFKGSIRLPGRFSVTSTRRWASILRFHGGGKVLMDDTGYGHVPRSPVNLYVEGKTSAQTAHGPMVVKPFEQTIRNIILCAHNGGTAIYLSENQDRLRIDTVKILGHQGSQLGIRHGPKLAEEKYPFPATQARKFNVWLTDPVFTDLQIEGPHNNRRPQAAIFATGANMIFNKINLYGWMHGLLLHGGVNRNISAITQHLGNTSDGRAFCSRDEVLSYCISYTRETVGTDSIVGVSGKFRKWYKMKHQQAPYTCGWYEKGEGIL